MASIITLDGVRGATDEYGEEIPTGLTLDDAARSFIGWGFLAFGLGTAFFRARTGLKRRGLLGRSRRR